MSLTLETIREAATELQGEVVRTPFSHSRKLSERADAELSFKFENLQFTGSFKDRGALVKLRSLDEEQRERGVIAMSAGNHAQAVAYRASQLGVPATIIMPQHTPNVKVERTRQFGAEVVLEGEDLAEAGDVAEGIVEERGLTLIHPYDDERIIAGQGTVALEVLEADPELQSLVVPVGGGGLIAGIATAAKSMRPEIEVVGVQAARYPSMRQALEGEPIECGHSTIAEGIAVKRPGKLTLPIVRELVDDVLLVEEADLEEAVQLLLEQEKTVAEGAGAAGLACVMEHGERFRGRKVGIVISGGNADLLNLSSIIERGLVRSGRMVWLRVEIRDVPGQLADVAQKIADSDGNIVEVYHQRAFTQLPVQSAELDVVVQTRGVDHVREIIQELEEAGFPTTVRHGIRVDGSD